MSEGVNNICGNGAFVRKTYLEEAVSEGVNGVSRGRLILNTLAVSHLGGLRFA